MSTSRHSHILRHIDETGYPIASTESTIRMKNVIKEILDSSPNFEPLRDVVSGALNEALDVEFSESEAMILAHTVVGILSARKEASSSAVSATDTTTSPFSTSKTGKEETGKNQQAEIEWDDGTGLSFSLGPPHVEPEHNRRHEVVAASENFPLMKLDDHDVLPNILTYLPFEDLNSLSVCSRRLRALRSDPDLDQTRSATLVFADNTRGNSFIRLVTAINEYNLHEVLRGNRVALRLVGYLEAFDDATMLSELPLDAVTLRNITILDLSHAKRPVNPYIEVYSALSRETLGRVLPNVQKLDLSFANDDCSSLYMLKIVFPTLVSLTAIDSNVDVLSDGSTMRTWGALRELYAPGQPSLWNDSKANLHYGLPPNIERLDIRFLKKGGDPLEETQLLNILRHCRSLQWLRCDATPIVLGHLKQARPDVTIVNF
jgi:hypothetical protein